MKPNKNDDASERPLDLIVGPPRSPRTPKAHAKHGEKPCGCWVGKEHSVSCPWCGASYNLYEVMEFPRWRCYDCHGGFTATNLKPNVELTGAAPHGQQTKLQETEK